MVGPADDIKLSAFWNMCFSKPPHFENRGAAPDPFAKSKKTVFLEFRPKTYNR